LATLDHWGGNQRRREFSDDPILEAHAARVANQVRAMGGYTHVEVRAGSGFFVDASFNDHLTDPRIAEGTAVITINPYLSTLSLPLRALHEANHVRVRNSGELSKIDFALTHPRLGRIRLLRELVNWYREERLVNRLTETQLTEHAHAVSDLASDATRLMAEVQRTQDHNIGQTMTHWLASLLKKHRVNREELATVDFARRGFLSAA
jgi:hypothetical protein